MRGRWWALLLCGLACAGIASERGKWPVQSWVSQEIGAAQDTSDILQLPDGRLLFANIGGLLVFGFRLIASEGAAPAAPLRSFRGNAAGERPRRRLALQERSALAVPSTALHLPSMLQSCMAASTDMPIIPRRNLPFSRTCMVASAAAEVGA